MSPQKTNFDVNEETIELREIKYFSYILLQRVSPDFESSLSANDYVLYGKKIAKTFALLVIFPDVENLLIIRDCWNKGKRALEILRNYYIGNIVLLYHTRNSSFREIGKMVIVQPMKENS